MAAVTPLMSQNAPHFCVSLCFFSITRFLPPVRRFQKSPAEAPQGFASRPTNTDGGEGRGGDARLRVLHSVSSPSLFT